MHTDQPLEYGIQRHPRRRRWFWRLYALYMLAAVLLIVVVPAATYSHPVDLGNAKVGVHIASGEYDLWLSVVGDFPCPWEMLLSWLVIFPHIVWALWRFSRRGKGG